MVVCDSICSCSCTSVLYSELLSADGSIAERKAELQCTCPHPAVRPVASSYGAPLQTTTCLPQPLPATPQLSREPDYLRLEKTFISADRVRPFEFLEPQAVYYARSFQKHLGEWFSCRGDNLVQLRCYHKCLADWTVPRDSRNTPFQSVVFARTARQAENLPRLVEEEAGPMPQDVPGVSDLTVQSNAFGSIYKAMGSRESQLSGESEDEEEEEKTADRVISVWQEIFVEESWSTGLSRQATFVDSGDETLWGTAETEAPREEDFDLWYRELEKMDHFLDEAALPSLSNLSCTTASSFSLLPQTTITSSSRSLTSLAPTKTPCHGSMGKSLYCRVRKFFLGGAVNLVNKKKV